MFSYSEDDMVEDHKLPEHLAHWGINIAQMEKSDKSMIELEIDFNKKMEWNKFFDNDNQVSICGPGLTGMINLGNGCYLNSVIQVLFSIEDFINRYNIDEKVLLRQLPSDPVNDFNFQM